MPCLDAYLVPAQKKQKFLVMMRTCTVPRCDLASAWAALPKAMEIVAPSVGNQLPAHTT
jgi:hypothetical protein